MILRERATDLRRAVDRRARRETPRVPRPEADLEDDDRLMIRYREGDARAFERLYERWERRVYGFCLRYLGDRDLAADAFQETFRRLVEGRDRYEPRGRFAAWLFTLARRASVELLRARSDREETPLEEAGSGAVAGHAAVGAASPEKEALDRSEIGRLLGRLPPAQREALLLAKGYGFAYAEIAAMVGATEAAVKQRVYRALRTLEEEA